MEFVGSPSMNSSARCGVVVDRHVPKTAGTTVRTFLRENQRLRACDYVGYDVGRTWQSRVGFTHRSISDVRHQLNRPPLSSHRLCVEAHMVGGSFWAELALLRTTRFARRCNIVVMLRVREPLSWYRSYFDWAVLSRQKTGNAPQWGVNFTDWLPANMQARFLLHGTRGQPSEWAPEVARRRSGPAIGPDRWAELEANVRAADVVAPLERLDESLRLAIALSGFLATPQYVTSKPQVMHGPWERLPKVTRVLPAAEFCARDGAECAAAVRAAAPADHRLYDLAQALFAQQWHSAFGKDLPPLKPRAAKAAASPPPAAAGAAAASPTERYSKRYGERYGKQRGVRRRVRSAARSR